MPNSPKPVSPGGDDEDWDDLVSEARIRTPQFDLEPFADAMEEAEDSEVRRVGSADEPILVKQMLEAHAACDYAAAIDWANRVLSHNPRHAVAAECIRECREAIEEQLYVRLSGVPRVIQAVAKDTPIDHRAAFVLSRIDGMTSVEDLVDLCGMPRLELLQALDQLVATGLVDIG